MTLETCACRQPTTPRTSGIGIDPDRSLPFVALHNLNAIHLKLPLNPKLRPCRVSFAFRWISYIVHKFGQIRIDIE